MLAWIWCYLGYWALPAVSRIENLFRIVPCDRDSGASVDSSTFHHRNRNYSLWARCSPMCSYPFASRDHVQILREEEIKTQIWNDNAIMNQWSTDANWLAASCIKWLSWVDGVSMNESNDSIAMQWLVLVGWVSWMSYRLPFKPSGRTVFGLIVICAIVTRFIVCIMSI